MNLRFIHFDGCYKRSLRAFSKEGENVKHEMRIMTKLQGDLTKERRGLETETKAVLLLQVTVIIQNILHCNPSTPSVSLFLLHATINLHTRSSHRNKR